MGLRKQLEPAEQDMFIYLDIGKQQEQIVLERSARLNLDPGKGDR